MGGEQVSIPMSVLANFGNFLGPDTLVIFLIILILFGGKRFPELMRGWDRALDEFGKEARKYSEGKPFDVIDWIVIGLLAGPVVAGFLCLVAEHAG